MLDEFFEDGELRKFVESRTNRVDPWIGTSYEGYLNLATVSKGTFGEKLVSKIMLKNGSEVARKKNKGHDRIIDGYKTEIKFSLSEKKDHFIFNHLACHKDWERAILLGVNHNGHYRMNWIYKKDFIENINLNTGVFKTQQGGDESDNDDYMFSGDYSKLKSAKILQEMDDWKKDGPKKTGIFLWT